MAIKRLRIEITGNNAPWNKAIDASIAKGHQFDQSRVTGGKKATQEQIISIQKLTSSAIDANLKRQASDKKTADAATATAKKASQASENAWQRANAAILRDFNRMQTEQARVSAKKARDDARDASASQRAWQKANAALLRDFNKQQAAAKKAADEQVSGQERVAASIGAVVGRLAAVGTAVMAIREGIQLWEQWNAATTKEAMELGHVREQLLELAALKGRLGDTTTENAAQLSFRGKTLQTQDAAREFQSQYINVSQSAVQGGLISEGESRKLMERGGAFQAAENGSANVHGGMIGSLASMLGPKPGGGQWTAAEVSAHYQKIFNQQQAGSFTFSQGAEQLMGLQGTLGTGAFGQGPEAVHQLAAMHAAISNQTKPGEAGTMTEQVVEALTGSQLRMRGPKIEQHEGDQKLAEYYKSIGAGTDQNLTTPQIAQKVMGDLAQQEQAGGAMTQDNLYHYLQSKGFMNRQSIMGIGALYKAQQTGQLRSHMDRAGTATGLNAADVNAPGFVPFEQRMSNFSMGPVADQRRAEIGDLASKTAAGLPNEKATQLRRLAFQSLVASGQAKGDFSDWDQDWKLGGRNRINQELNRVMAAEAKRGGLNVGGLDSQSGLARTVGGMDIGTATYQTDTAQNRQLGPIFSAIEQATKRSLSEAILERILIQQQKQTALQQKREAATQIPQAIPPRPAVVGRP